MGVGKKRGILEGPVPGALWAWSRTHESHGDFLPQLGKLRSRKVKGGPQPSLLVSGLFPPPPHHHFSSSPNTAKWWKDSPCPPSLGGALGGSYPQGPGLTATKNMVKR